VPGTSLGQANERYLRHLLPGPYFLENADRVEVLLAQHLFSPTPQIAPQRHAMQDLLDKMMQKDTAQHMDSAQTVVDYITSRWSFACGTA
jgi:hypothetical protein